jgi:hypothetical protein
MGILHREGLIVTKTDVYGGGMAGELAQVWLHSELSAGMRPATMCLRCTNRQSNCSLISCTCCSRVAYKPEATHTPLCTPEVLLHQLPLPLPLQVRLVQQ